MSKDYLEVQSIFARGPARILQTSFEEDSKDKETSEQELGEMIW